MGRLCARVLRTPMGRAYFWVRERTEFSESGFLRWTGLVVCLVLLLFMELRVVEGK